MIWSAAMSDLYPIFFVGSMGLDWVEVAQSTSGGVAAGATEARALHAGGASNLRQTVELRETWHQQSWDHTQ
jgi:hypothetical protein